MPAVCTVVLSWNRADTTIECLESLTRSLHAHLDVVVVDNASRDDSVARIGSRFPEIPVIRNAANLGYAGGNNVGIRFALERGADFVLLLNDDVVMEPDTIGHMLAAADRNVAAVGCKVRIFERPDRLWAAGNPEFFTAEWFPRDEGQFDSPSELEYAAGCCILLRASVLREIGYLDPRYFCEFEETDWCHRARRRGYRVVYEPRAVVHHKESMSFTSLRSPAFHYLFVRNRLLFLETNHLMTPWRPRALYALRAWIAEIRLILRAGSGRRRRAAAATLGVRDYFRRRFGAPPATL